MTKWFNVKGPRIAHKHYMVDISDRLEKMKQLIDREEYFVINRGRQYGKTTKKEIKQEWICAHGKPILEVQV